MRAKTVLYKRETKGQTKQKYKER